MEVQNSTLCYIRKNDQYLMLHRVSKKNDINRDKWIGVGGHFEAGESPEECLLREVREETGLRLTKWKFHGVVTFVVADGPLHSVADRSSHAAVQQAEYMYLFTATDAEGGLDGPLPDCDEGVLEWVDIDRIDTLPLWEGDRIFFRLIAKDHPVFLLKLTYDTDGHLVQALLDGSEVAR